MNLTIGKKTIALTRCDQRRNHKKGFFLELVIPKDSIGMDELYALLDGCTEAIVITKDDGTENTYIGFKEIGFFSLEDGNYNVWQVATSETDAQLSIAQNKIAEQDAVIAGMQNTMETQNTVIAAQVETIAALEAQNKELNETINALLGLEEE